MSEPAHAVAPINAIYEVLTDINLPQLRLPAGSLIVYRRTREGRPVVVEVALDVETLLELLAFHRESLDEIVARNDVADGAGLSAPSTPILRLEH